MTCLRNCFRKKVVPPKQTIDVIEEFSRTLNIDLFTYKDLSIATENFSPAMKIGEGGFGLVYKGTLKNGVMVAIKVLSAKSCQGVKEFLTELTVISDIKHKNLVQLYGCCVEGGRRILVYGYLENNSLAQTLLGGVHTSIPFDWERRAIICIGVAKGLMFLHEEADPRIIHRDIKASNILLDRDLTPKISDFGLAKLFPDNQTHISTCVAGTIGYLAPEYAIQGKLTRKADVYSFGVLLLEIVSGRGNYNKLLPVGEQNLLERAWNMYERGKLARLVDASLEGDAHVDEACKFLKIALLCIQDNPKLRPSMSKVVKMMMRDFEIDETKMSRPGLISELKGLKTAKDSLYTSSSTNIKEQNDSSSFGNTDASCATMTFTSIYDRSL